MVCFSDLCDILYLDKKQKVDLEDYFSFIVNFNNEEKYLNFLNTLNFLYLNQIIKEDKIRNDIEKYYKKRFKVKDVSKFQNLIDNNFYYVITDKNKYINISFYDKLYRGKITELKFNKNFCYFDYYVKDINKTFKNISFNKYITN